MKYRLDYVSNSSSSSFIVIGNNREKYNFNYQDLTVPNFDSGCVTFNRLPAKYVTFWDKLNFCVIQIATLLLDTDDKKINTGKYFLKLLKEVCKENFNLDITMNNLITIDHNCCIDHSSSVEEDKNIEMFKDKETLINFLSASDSYIQFV